MHRAGEPSAEQLLAAAVVRQAIADARDHPIRAERERARYFLEASEAFEFWCLVLGVAAAGLRRLALQAIKDGPSHRSLTRGRSLSDRRIARRARAAAWLASGARSGSRPGQRATVPEQS